MQRNQEDPFDEYAPEPQTSAPPRVEETIPPDEVDAENYGVGKPRRIIVRGIIAKD